MKANPALLRSSLANDHLQLILMPTEACNFRCTYCYEDFKLGRMKANVVGGVKQLLARRVRELNELTLSWFGGEPLLARDIMLDVLEHTAELLAKRPHVRFHSDVTTNGYLLDRELFERLLVLGVNQYQISFDGPERLHDEKRVLAGGGGTFERVWRNVTALREVPGHFQVRVRLHVDRENAAAIPEFAEQCREAFEGDGRFEVFIRALSAFGGPNDDTLPLLDGDEAREVFADLRERLQPGPPAISGSGGPEVCYASRGNSLVIRSDGRLGKCTVALQHPSNTVGRLLEDGTVELDKSRMLGWMRGLRSGDEEELHCPMIGFADAGVGFAGRTEAEAAAG